jgi:hypothetical protein
LSAIKEHLSEIEVYDAVHEGERFDLQTHDYRLVLCGLFGCIILNLVFWFCAWLKHKQFMKHLNRRRAPASVYEVAESYGEGDKEFEASRTLGQPNQL